MRLLIQFALVYFLFTSCVLWSQSHKSIHQLEFEKHQGLPYHVSNFDVLGNDIIPYNYDERVGPSSTVFGYLPYWKYQESLSYLQYDLLSHIAVFAFPVSSQGDISYPSYWPWTDLINAAHAANVKVIMCVTNFNGDEIHNLLTNSPAQTNFFGQVSQIIQTYNLQGVNIDFENVISADRGVVLNNFLDDLTNYLHNKNDETEVSFAAPPVNWGGWDFEGLAAACDYLFVMGYNFYGPWSQTSGPCAPLTGGNYNITKVLDEEYNSIVLDYPEKIILGVPYYGNLWQTQNAQSYSTALNHIDQLSYQTAVGLINDEALIWDDLSQTSWYTYQEQGDWHQLWIDSDSSLGMKYELAESLMLKGVGIWALGYDNGRPELWDELRRKYVTPAANEMIYSPREIDLSFTNRAELLTIKYSLPQKSNTQLSIININGQCLWSATKNNLNSGEHIQEINIAHLNKGIYLFRIIIENKAAYSQSVIKIPNNNN
jgi:spore germination protein YaaH